MLSDAEQAAANGKVCEALSQMLSATGLEQASDESGDEFIRRRFVVLEHLVGRLQAHFGKREWQLDDPPAGVPDLRDPRCSFCSKKQSEAVKLVAGYGVWICDECIRVCAETVE